MQVTSREGPRRRSVLGLLGGALAARAAPAQPVPATLRTVVDDAMRPLLSTHRAPGLAVGVAVDGERHFFHYGVASRESRAPVTFGTLFEIGSLSKTLTATFVAYAQALGHFSLDQTPGRYVPALRGSALDRAPMLDFATYTAGGLPLQFPDGIATLDEALDFLRRFQPAAAPGAQRRYSNPSIGLAGYAAAQAMHGDFAQLCERELFPRLGLKHTFIHVPAAALPAYAWGYAKENRPIRVNPGVFDAQAYGVKTTADDLLRFVEANLQPGPLEPAVRRAVAATHEGHYRVEGMVQGLGWEQYPWPIGLDALQAGNAGTMALDAHAARRIVPPRAANDSTLFDKTGSTNGFGAYAAFVPARKLGIVMLANRNVPIPARIAAAHAVLKSLGG